MGQRPRGKPLKVASEMDQTDHHLQILSVFHYVVAGLAALFALIPVVHLGIGIGILTGAFGSSSHGPDARFVGVLLIGLAVGIILCGWAFASCVFLAGRFLSSYRHYTYCLAMAGVECIFTPFGTVLGVFTIILLTRRDVRARFEGQVQPVVSGA